MPKTHVASVSELSNIIAQLGEERRRKQESEPTYNHEITIQLPNGDWSYRRLFSTFHEAAQAGPADAKALKGQLIRIERL